MPDGDGVNHRPCCFTYFYSTLLKTILDNCIEIFESFFCLLSLIGQYRRNDFQLSGLDDTVHTGGSL